MARSPWCELVCVNRTLYLPTCYVLDMRVLATILCQCMLVIEARLMLEYIFGLAPIH